jgi:hypothetical protein
MIDCNIAVDGDRGMVRRGFLSRIAYAWLLLKRSAKQHVFAFFLTSKGLFDPPFRLSHTDFIEMG